MVNVLFILYHHIYYYESEEKLKSRKDEGKYQIRNFETRFEYSDIELLHTTSFTRKEDFEDYYFFLLTHFEKNQILHEHLLNNKSFIKSYYNANKLDISKNVTDDIFQKINNFIETGIII